MPLPMLSREPAELARQLSLAAPIVQAPMAGGITTPALVAAVSAAGALGSLAGALLAPSVLRQQIEAVRALSSAPFAVNLFVQRPPRVDPVTLDSALQRLAPEYTRQGLELRRPMRWCESVDEQIEVLLEARVPVVSFAFDLLEPARVQALRQAGQRVIGTATTVAEAVAWAEAGADAVCAQGWEAGGHRGGFAAALDAEQLGLMALLPRVCAAVPIPVIAAGGLMDGAGIAAALALGASAVQLGTAFLCVDEAGTHPAWRQRLLQGRDDETRVTRVFSGRPARGLRNRFIDDWQAHEAAVPAYPVQNALTAALRAQAAQASDAGTMSLWAGQGHGRVRQGPAAALVKSLIDETRAAQARLAHACSWASAAR